MVEMIASIRAGSAAPRQIQSPLDRAVADAAAQAQSQEDQGRNPDFRQQLLGRLKATGDFTDTDAWRITNLLRATPNDAGGWAKVLQLDELAGHLEMRTTLDRAQQVEDRSREGEGEIAFLKAFIKRPLVPEIPITDKDEVAAILAWAGKTDAQGEGSVQETSQGRAFVFSRDGWQYNVFENGTITKSAAGSPTIRMRAEISAYIKERQEVPSVLAVELSKQIATNGKRINELCLTLGLVCAPLPPLDLGLEGLPGYVKGGLRRTNWFA